MPLGGSWVRVPLALWCAAVHGPACDRRGAAVNVVVKDPVTNQSLPLPSVSEPAAPSTGGGGGSAGPSGATSGDASGGSAAGSGAGAGAGPSVGLGGAEGAAASAASDPASAAASGGLQLLVQLLNGTREPVDVHADQCFRDIKGLLESKVPGVPAGRMRLIFRGETVEDAATPRSLGASNGSVVHFVLTEVRGEGLGCV